jgi:hypothetical protein
VPTSFERLSVIVSVQFAAIDCPRIVWNPVDAVPCAGR